MKIDANVWFNPVLTKRLGVCQTRVPVDMDYVESSSESIEEWVRNELEDKFGISIDEAGPEPFVIENINDIIEDIKFEEFQDKTAEDY